MKTRNISVLMLALVLLALPALVQADTMVKSVFHQDAMSMMGQSTPETNDTSMTWFGSDAAMMTDGKTTATLIDAKTGMITQIDHAKKEYTQMPVEALGDVEKMMAGSGVDPAEAAAFGQQMKAMAAAMTMDAKVTPTEETKKIGDWDCKKYLLEIKMGQMGSMKNVVWATKDVEIDYTMLAKLMSSSMFAMPGFDGVLEEMKKIEGLQILNEATMSMMGNEVKNKTEVIEVKTGDAPDGTFDVPEGYKKVEFEVKMGM